MPFLTPLVGWLVGASI